jgi:Leucine-rich repeat (LRR) protein
MILFCKQTTALVLNLSKNSLQDLPNEIEILNDQLNELNISFNKFLYLPTYIFHLTNLITLDLRGNQLSTIPNEIKNLKGLRELIIADNK